MQVEKNKYMYVLYFFILILIFFLGGDKYILRKARRFFAVKKAGKFISINASVYTIKNNNVILIYNDKKLEITCIGKTCGNKRIVVTKEQYEDELIYDIDDFFRKNFDEICTFFNENTTYSEIIKNLEFNLNDKNTSYIQNQMKSQRHQREFNSDENMQDNSKEYKTHYIGMQTPLDINAASAEEIAKLPGINIILAKKIVNYRNLHNGFKSKNEFYYQMKIKLHFQIQLDNLITVNEFEWKENNNDDNERLIDF